MTDQEEQLTDIRRDLFIQIRILCDPINKIDGPVTRQVSRTAGSSLSDLHQLLADVQNPEDTIDAVLIDVIIYPLLRLFKQTTQMASRSDTIIQGVLEILLFLLNNTTWTCSFTPMVMKQYLIFFTNCLDQTRQSNKLSNQDIGGGETNPTLATGATETIKLLAIQCLSATLPKPPSTSRHNKKDRLYCHHLLPELFTEPFIYVLSQSISELLATIKDDHDLALRLAALDTLKQLLFDNIQESNHLLSFMPGVVSNLSKVVWQKQEKENNQVIAYAVDLIGDMVQTVMDNGWNKRFIHHVDSLDDLVHVWHSVNERQETQHNGDRTAEWYSKSKSALYTLLKTLVNISRHPNWHVRLAFVHLSHKLLACCWGTLDNCIPLLIDTMVQLIDDDFPQVATACKDRITQLKSTGLFETTLMPELKQGLYNAIMGLPQQLISGDEQTKLYAMRRITGYTYFLQHHAETVFNTSLNRISDGWIAALEIDNHSLDVLEEKQAARYIELENDGSLKSIGFPKLRFKHLVTTATADQAAHMLNVIGTYAPIQRWLTHFMAYIQVDTYSTDNTLASLDQLLPQAAFIVHSLLAGAAAGINQVGQDDFAMDSMVAYDDDRDNRLATMALQKEAQRILTDMTETLTAATVATPKKAAVMADHATTVDLEGNKVVTVCLGLQMVSLAVGVLGKDRTVEHLITLLYPILAHLGSTNVAIHSYARIALDNIALVCGERNGRLLAMNNMDYIINAVSQRISLLYDNPQAPLVLKALVHVCGVASLDYLQDSVEEIFDALDRYHLHGDLCRQLCGVLVEIVQSAATSIPTPAATPVDISQPSSAGQVSTPIREFIKLHMEAKDEASAAVLDAPQTMEDIGKYFLAQRKDGKADKDILELMAQTENAGKDDEQSTDDDDTTEQQSTEATTAPLTNTQDLTLKIMQKSIHFLTSSSDQLRSQMLQLFADGVRILATLPAKLDPLIHQAWPLIMNRLDDKTHYVAFYAAQVIQVISETRGEFIAQRFMENVWPRYERLLHQGNLNMGSASMIYSTYSYPHRLQRCLLETLVRAVDHIPLNQQVALAVVESTTWLLSQTRVHPELQTLTIRLYLALFQHHPDTVWLHVFSLLETPVLHPPPLPDDLGIKLDTLVVPDWMAAHNKDYYANAAKIMASMEQENRA